MCCIFHPCQGSEFRTTYHGFVSYKLLVLETWEFFPFMHASLVLHLLKFESFSCILGFITLDNSLANYLCWFMQIGELRVNLANCQDSKQSCLIWILKFDMMQEMSFFGIEFHKFKKSTSQAHDIQAENFCFFSSNYQECLSGCNKRRSRIISSYTIICCSSRDAG